MQEDNAVVQQYNIFEFIEITGGEGERDGFLFIFPHMNDILCLVSIFGLSH